MLAAVTKRHTANCGRILMAVFSTRWRIKIFGTRAGVCLQRCAVAQERQVIAPDLTADSCRSPEPRHGGRAGKLAANVGADILRQGGNAVDAAVATRLCMAVTLSAAPRISRRRLHGDPFRRASRRRCIDYRETAPAAITRDIYLGPDGKPDADKSRNSALGIGVPARAAGLTLALEKYGSGRSRWRKFSSLIELARDGFVVTDEWPTPCRTCTAGWRAGVMQSLRTSTAAHLHDRRPRHPRYCPARCPAMSSVTTKPSRASSMAG